MLRRIALSLGLMLSLGVAAQADPCCYGTVHHIQGNTVWVQTQQGMYSVPVASASFNVGGVRVNLAALQPGMPVYVTAPVLTPVQYVQPQPVHVQQPVYIQQPRPVYVQQQPVYVQPQPVYHVNYGKGKHKKNKHRDRCDD